MNVIEALVTGSALWLGGWTATQCRGGGSAAPLGGYLVGVLAGLGFWSALQWMLARAGSWRPVAGPRTEWCIAVATGTGGAATAALLGGWFSADRGVVGGVAGVTIGVLFGIGTYAQIRSAVADSARRAGHLHGSTR